METYYFHGTTVDGYRFTIAGRYDSEETYPTTLTLGVSLCSRTDQFRKSKGRDQAKERLDKCDSSWFGVRCIALYLERAARELLGYAPEDFSKIKIFITAASHYNRLTRNRLKQDFNLIQIES